MHKKAFFLMVPAIAACMVLFGLCPNQRANEIAERGDTFFARQDYDLAIECWTDAINQDSKLAAGLNPKLAAAYINRATESLNRLWDLEDDTVDKEVISDFTHAIKLDPDNPAAYIRRGAALLFSGADYDSFIKDFNQAIKLDPNNVEAYIWRGLSIMDFEEDYDSAIKDFNQAIKLDPDNAGAYYLRAGAYYEKDDEQKGDADFAMAEKLGLETHYLIEGIPPFPMVEFGTSANSRTNANNASGNSGRADDNKSAPRKPPLQKSIVSRLQTTRYMSPAAMCMPQGMKTTKRDTGKMETESIWNKKVCV
jgi:tetratricopeptide (TPR) repeat protein